MAELDAHEWFRFGGHHMYRVPDERTEQFLALQRRAQVIYEATALDWSLWRTQQDPEQWFEHGPDFREQADLDRAAEGFEAQPDLLRGLAEFDDEREGMMSFSGVNWKPVLSMHRDAPIIEPSDASDALKLARRLAQAMAPRLDRVLPEPYSARCSDSSVCVNGPGPWGDESWDLVDFEIETAIHMVLDGVQDQIVEDTTDAWPTRPGQVGLAIDEVEIGDEVIRWWYGEKDAPVLELDPIPLAELDGLEKLLAD